MVNLKLKWMLLLTPLVLAGIQIWIIDETTAIAVQTLPITYTAVFTALLARYASGVKNELRIAEELRQLRRVEELAMKFYEAGVKGDEEAKNIAEVELVHLARRFNIDGIDALETHIQHLAIQLRSENEPTSETDSPAYKAIEKVLERTNQLVNASLKQ